ncbi:MAG: PIG-L deacetylase family protein [Thermoanaerobaculia bacterium]
MTLPGSISERDLMPYEASLFSAATVLVVAPHPDDEVFGCGAAIAQLNASGAQVTVLLVTDGAAAGADASERLRIARVREAESRAALLLLGGGRVVSAGLPDRGTWERRAELLEALARWCKELSPQLVFVPSAAEVHPDHRAVADAFLEFAASSSASDALFPGAGSAQVAFYEVSQPIRPNFLLDATAHVAAKERAMAAFASQLGGHDYPAFMRGLMAYRRMTLPPSVTAAEGFFVVPFSALRELKAASLVSAFGPSRLPDPSAAGEPPAPGAASRWFARLRS